MERVARWLLLALVVAEVALVWVGLLNLNIAVGVVVGIELLLLLLASRQVVVAVRRYRRDRSAGLDVWSALEEGLAVLLPRPVARLAATEPRLWACLWKWLLRRHRPVEGEFGYHKRSILGAFLVVVLFTTPVELLLFELVVPWLWLRWLLLVVAVYALFWIFGFYASLVVLPHRLEAYGVRLHYGILASGQIPYAEIAEVELARRKAPGGGDGLKHVPREEAAYLAVSGRTDVTLRLRDACSLRRMLGQTPPVTTVHVAADDPERLARELSRRVGAGPAVAS